MLHARGTTEQMPARTIGIPDVYVYRHAETGTFLVQIATGKANPLWREFTPNQIPNTNCLAMANEAELERLWSVCDTLALNLRVNV